MLSNNMNNMNNMNILIIKIPIHIYHYITNVVCICNLLISLVVTEIQGGR